MPGKSVRFGSAESDNYADYAVIINPSTGLPVTSFGDGAGDASNPIGIIYAAIATSAGYLIGEEVLNTIIVNTAGIVTASTWFNLTTGTTIVTAPPYANLAARGSSNRAVRWTIASTVTSATVLAVNKLRKGARLLNNSTSFFYGLYGTGTASASNYSFVLAPLTVSPIVPAGLPSYEDVPIGFISSITGAWASANGTLLITEFT